MTNAPSAPSSTSSTAFSLAPASAPRSLRVMTYNVRYFGHGTRGLGSTGAGFKRIARAITALDPTPDIICLQEVETASLRANHMNPRQHRHETQLERIMRELHASLARAGKPDRYVAHYFPAHAYRLTARTNIYTTGLAVLARDSFHVVHHNAERPHDITFRRVNKRVKQTRICAHVAFEHEGQIFDVFNTHLSLPGFLYKEFWSGQARMGFGPNQLEEARQLARFVEEQRLSDNYVVVGDFNALPGSPVDLFLREERGLVDAFSHYHGIDAYEAREFPTAGFLNLRMHLDHVYASEKLRWIDFAGTHAFGAQGNFTGLSDHVPLIARCAAA
jgi:endonuclease/exonuclease/phosphatase family metal-dependent hydrolase